MFGLMKAHTCVMTDRERNLRRLHYCGTCKTLGSLYGAKTRFLLNHDTVFLAELLSVIATPGGFAEQWNSRLNSFNCFSCPAPADSLPLSLQYAATAAITLSEWKLADRINDSPRLLWRLLKRVFAPRFRSAKVCLTEWEFPLEELRSILSTQEQRELEASRCEMTPDRILEHVSEPTALATAMFCGHGAMLVGRGDSAPDMYVLGKSLGAIVYLLDAVEDFDRDRRSGDFNALRCAYSRLVKGRDSIPAEVREKIVDRIRNLQQEFEQALNRLPLPEADKTHFADRLAWNLKRTLALTPSSERCRLLSSVQPVEHACIPRMTFGLRWKQAVQAGASLSARFYPVSSGALISRLTHAVYRPVMFATVFPVAFFAPQQAAGAASYRECMSLALNVTVMGIVAASLLQMLSVAMPVAALQRLSFTGMDSAVAAEKKKRFCDYCDCCDCCSGCDCDGCNCCDGCSCD